ncbi:PaaI family thioesterase [bacterium]|nr:PaaI family thioesterase [bacterium]
MNINTHLKIDNSLCGRCLGLSEGRAAVELTLSENMAADERGLVHGGFIFGLADYAAMLAVNDPNVVLGAAEVKFLKPCVCGESIVAEAEVQEESGRRRSVKVSCRRGEDEVFAGIFTCFVLKNHVLEGK